MLFCFYLAQYIKEEYKQDNKIIKNTKPKSWEIVMQEKSFPPVSVCNVTKNN